MFISVCKIQIDKKCELAQLLIRLIISFEVLRASGKLNWQLW